MKEIMKGELLHQRETFRLLQATNIVNNATIIRTIVIKNVDKENPCILPHSKKY